MLTIREEQTRQLKHLPLAGFEDEIVEHWHAFSPRLCAVLGDEQLRVAVRHGVERAGTWGLTARGPVRLYLDVAMLLGSLFDTDPQYPWAAQALEAHTDAAPESQMRTAERLYEATSAYLETVSGPDDEHANAALQRLSAMGRQPLALTQEGFRDEMLDFTREMYPQKVEYVGDEALFELIDAGSEEALAHEMESADGRALLCALKFAFGHGCSGDPLYPWIGNTLSSEKIVDGEARTKRLRRKALTWLDEVLAHRAGGESG